MCWLDRPGARLTHRPPVLFSLAPPISLSRLLMDFYFHHWILEAYCPGIFSYLFIFSGGAHVGRAQVRIPLRLNSGQFNFLCSPRCYPTDCSCYWPPSAPIGKDLSAPPLGVQKEFDFHHLLYGAELNRSKVSFYLWREKEVVILLPSLCLPPN